MENDGDRGDGMGCFHAMKVALPMAIVAWVVIGMVAVLVLKLAGKM